MSSLLASRGRRLCPFWSFPRIVCVSALAVLFAAVGPCAAALAYVPEPVVQQSIPVIAEHLARGGAASIPGVSCGSTCSDLWLQEHRPIPYQPSSAQLHRELTNVRSRRVKVLPALKVLGSVALAAETFHLGWKIGEGLNAKFFRFGVPEKPAAVVSARLYHAAAGHVIRAWLPPMPYDGWYVEYQTTGGYRYAHIQRQLSSGGPTGSSRQCVLGPQVMPEGLEARPNGVVESCYRGTFMSEAWVMPEAGTIADGQSPIEDYVDQPYERATPSWVDAPPGLEQLETRTRNALESGDFRIAEPWYAHQLDPQTYEDPTEDEQQRDDCRPPDSVPAGDPQPLRGTEDFLQDPDRWRARYETVRAEEFPPGATVPESGLVATGGQAYMRWGWTSLNAKEEIDWEGWGFRKIVAKHGWGPTALEKTSEALLTLPVRVDNYDLYVGPPYTSSAGRPAACEWVVSVQREPYEMPDRPELSQGVPMGGIITAHGRYVTPG